MDNPRKWAPRCCEMADKARENHREWRERTREKGERRRSGHAF